MFSETVFPERLFQIFPSVELARLGVADVRLPGERRSQDRDAKREAQADGRRVGRRLRQRRGVDCQAHRRRTTFQVSLLIVGLSKNPQEKIGLREIQFSTKNLNKKEVFLTSREGRGDLHINTPQKLMNG